MAMIPLVTLLGLLSGQWAAAAAPPATQERMVEWTVESHKTYADPFNDVNVDVIFAKDGQSWRVPTFWRGGQQWTVRFAPPEPGEYDYRLESTDANNPDLNGHQGRIRVTAYSGPDELLRHGMLQVSANKRYFAYADGTPFYWLGDTWWTGLSDRLSWDGFQKLALDRQSKGFTVVQMAAGLVPTEEQAPVDPGHRNEGGAVWDPQFKQINPRYFDYVDRRIQFLLDHGMVPAIVGAWGATLNQMGVPKLEQHWRYLVARYGAYPVFWILGGEVLDPPPEVAGHYDSLIQSGIVRGWTEVARYLRATDPYHHPLTVHEESAPYDTALQDESLTDFDLFQIGHWGWPSIAAEVAQLNLHYSRTTVTKPLVVGEIGYEKLGETHFEDFQRTAFWLAMLNGAAGHTYGAAGVWEAYTADKPFQRNRWSIINWEEGMNLPGSYQVGLNAKLLRQYPWWRFQPHPEWVTPRGTTLLEPHTQTHDFEFGTFLPCEDCDTGDPVTQLESRYAATEWKARNGTFRLPYAAGIPREVRIVYVPSVGLLVPAVPTVLGLEPGVRYHAYWWEPSTGTRFDLGAVERPTPGPVLFEDSAHKRAAWKDDGATLSVLKNAKQTNATVSVAALSAAGAGLILRYQDSNNYVAAVYSPADKSLYLLDRRKGSDGHRLGKTPITSLSAHITLSVEVRDDEAAASVTDGERTYATPIVDIGDASSGSAGLMHLEPMSAAQQYSHFELRSSPALVKDTRLERSLFDAKGEHRGDLEGPGLTVSGHTTPGWGDFARDKHILLAAYRPNGLPMSGDWVLVLEAQTN